MTLASFSPALRAVILALTTAVVSAGGAVAATLSGASYQIDYLIPDTSTVYPFTNGPQFGVVGSGADAVLTVENVTFISFDFEETALKVRLNTILSSPTWNNAPFNGVRITLLSPGTFTDFAKTTASFGPIVSSFTANQLFINWANASYVNGSTADFAVAGSVAPVPLPAALPLLLVGLGGLAMIRRRRA